MDADDHCRDRHLSTRPTARAMVRQALEHRGLSPHAQKRLQDTGSSVGLRPWPVRLPRRRYGCRLACLSSGHAWPGDPRPALHCLLYRRRVEGPLLLRNEKQSPTSGAAHTRSSHAHGLTECGRLLRWDFVFRCVAAEGLPLVVCKEDSARQVGGLPAKHGQMINTPSDNHIDAEAGGQAMGGAQLTILYPAAAFERAVIDLDAPTLGVPLHALLGVLKGGGLDSGHQHPFNGVVADDVLGLFAHIYCAGWNGLGAFQAFWWLQFELREAYVQGRVTCLALTAAQDMQGKRSVYLSAGHKVPLGDAADFTPGRPVHADQQSGTGWIAARLQKQFVDVGFAIPNADQLRVRARFLNFGHFTET